MKIYIPLFSLVITLFFLVPGCSKNAEPVLPDEEVLEDTTTFPHLMLAAFERQGAARIFANGHEIFDSVYAKSFVSDADLFYFQNAEPPRKIQFESKDTLGIFYQTEPAKFGIHREENVDLLYNRYPMGGIFEDDTTMVNYTINAQTGMAHDVLTGYGDYKEYTIPVFAFKLVHYIKDYYDSTKTHSSGGRMSWKLSAFKDSYMNTLGPLDTFAVQEYEIVFRKR